jgi:quercetin dioxygenase-like cupin family protein
MPEPQQLNLPAIEVKPGDWIALDDGRLHEVVETEWVEVDHLHVLVTLTVGELDGQKIEVSGAQHFDVERPTED